MITQELLNNIMRQLRAIFPQGANAFADKQALIDYRNQLGTALVENGYVTPAIIQLGFKRARASGSAFYPSVAQFVAMCKPRPEDFGELSIDQAYQQAVLGSYKGRRHQAGRLVLLAMRKLPESALSGQNEAKAKELFKLAYQDALEDVYLRNAELPDLIEHHHGAVVVTDSDKQAGRATLDELFNSVFAS